MPLAQLFVERDYRDLVTPERAGITNSLGAALFGSDYTTQVDTRAAGIMLRRDPRDPWMLRVAYETDDPLQALAQPASGRPFAAAPSAWKLRGVRAELRGTGGWVSGGPTSTRGLWSLSASLGAYTRDAEALPLVPGPGFEGADIPASHPVAARVIGALSLEQRAGGNRTLVSQTLVGAAGGESLPPQWLVFAGGPTSAPGYGFSSFATRGYVSQRFELRQPIPSPAISLGKYGKAPGHITLAPFVQAIAVASGTRDVSSPPAGVYPSAGIGALFFFDLIRADVARGLRQGGWRFNIDIDRGFWGIL